MTNNYPLKIKKIKEQIKNLERLKTSELNAEQKRDVNLKINELQKELSSLKDEYAYQKSIAREFGSAKAELSVKKYKKEFDDRMAEFEVLRMDIDTEEDFNKVREHIDSIIECGTNYFTADYNDVNKNMIEVCNKMYDMLLPYGSSEGFCNLALERVATLTLDYASKSGNVSYDEQALIYIHYANVFCVREPSKFIEYYVKALKTVEQAKGRSSSEYYKILEMGFDNIIYEPYCKQYVDVFENATKGASGSDLERFNKVLTQVKSWPK